MKLFAKGGIELIACYQHCCAFYQNGASGTTNETSGRIDRLLDYGCRICGSIPIVENGDAHGGELTVNYVYNYKDRCNAEEMNPLCVPSPSD